MAILVPVSEDDQRSFQLGVVSTLGRESTNTVALRDPMISRRHATIHRAADGRYVISDLGSLHGTFVGNERISTAILTPGDEIRVGCTRLRFDPEAAAQRSARLQIVDRIDPLVRKRKTVVPEERFRAERDVNEMDLLRRDYEKLRAAYQITRSIGIEHNLDALFDRILDTAFELLPGDRGTIVLVDSATCQPSSGLARLRSGPRLDAFFSQTIIEEVLLARTGIISGNTVLDGRFDHSDSIAGQNIRSTICVPLLYLEEVLGFIQLDSQIALDSYSEKDLELLTTVASQAALALKNVTLARQIHDVTVEQRGRLERVVRCLPTAVLLLDAESRIVLTNVRADELLPSLSTARRGDLLEMLGPLPLDEILGARQPLEIAAGPTQSRRNYLVATTTEALSLGGRGETVVSIQDVTEAREQEQRSARADRMTLVGQLAGGVAHDFNNLLSVILSYSDFLGESLTDPEARADVEHIHEAGQRAAALTRQLLAFSRREVVSPQVVDCNRVVSGMISLLERTLGENIRLSQELSSGLWKVSADPGRLEQVLMNLIVNSRDAMPSGGRLVIETRNLEIHAPEAHHGELIAPGAYVMISVADTGCGMPAEVAARVFEPFFTTKDRGKGTGLGLATVYGIVKQAGGHIWVQSEPGAGTTFLICMPVTDQHEPAASAGVRVGPAATGGEMILVVEDEDAVRALTTRILRGAGYSVIEADSAEDALALCATRQVPVDLLLTDLVMPELSGQELAKRLIERWPTLPVLFMTGYTDLALNAGDGGGLIKVVEKPFAREELLRHVREVLDDWRVSDDEPTAVRLAAAETLPISSATGL